MSMIVSQMFSRVFSTAANSNSLVRLFWMRQDKSSLRSVQVQMNYNAAYLKLLICGLFFPLTVFKQIKEDASVTDLYSILCESIRRPIAKPNRSNSRSYVSIIRADDPLQKNEYWCLLTLCRNVVWDEAMQAAACYATEHTAARKND